MTTTTLEDLLTQFHGITLLVGANGSGKSRMLGALATGHLDRRRQVIAIANTIFDKFPHRRRHFSLLSARYGRLHPASIFKKAFTASDKGVIRNARAVGETLKYCGFAATVGLHVRFTPEDVDGGPNMERAADRLQEHGAKPEELSTIMAALRIFLAQSSELGSAWLDLEGKGPIGPNRLQILDLLQFEPLLKRSSVIESLSVSVQKGRDIFDLHEGSSGELSLISTYAFVATQIKENAVILVDEPENSLHPQWQREYCSRLLDLFSLYQPQIVLATHSPMILSGGQMEPGTRVLKVRGPELADPMPSTPNVEETLWTSFDVLPPENHYLSASLAQMLDALNSGQISLGQAQEQIKGFRTQSYDQRQQALLARIEEVAARLATGTLPEEGENG